MNSTITSSTSTSTSTTTTDIGNAAAGRAAGSGSPPVVAPAAIGPEPRIAIVGGSLTGPALALLLLQAGFSRVCVYEATARNLARAGGLIGLEHSCLDILDRLGIDQPEVLACASETVLDIRLRQRRLVDVAHLTYPGRLTTWTLLHQALNTRLPDRLVHTRARVTGLSTRRGRPLLHFADGTTATADLIVFADGRASTGRRLLDPGRHLRFAGYVAHRGETTSTAATVAGPGAGVPERFLRIDPGPGAQFSLGPVPGGLDWVLFLDTTRQQFTDAFGARPEQVPYLPPGRVPTAVRALVDAHAGRLLPDEHANVVQTADVRTVVPVLDIDPPTRMTWPVGDGHAVLLGDALAPVRPHTARGANNGIEQAAGLTAALTQHRRHGADLAAALRGWQHRYLPTAAHWVTRGPHIGASLGLGLGLGLGVGVGR